MKKLLLLLLTILTLGFAAGPLSAQETVTIGDSTGNGYYIPVNMYYNYSLTQQIITADEISDAGGSAGTINSISFYYMYTSAFTLSGVKIYMLNVDKTEFSSTTDMVAVTESDKVFDGTISASSKGWVTITLDTPFEYNGTDNLLICCYDPTSGYPGSSYTFNTSNTTGRYAAITYYSDSYTPSLTNITTFSGSTTRYTYHNRIQLDIMPSGSNCFAPKTPSITDITPYTATFTWTPREGQTEWEVYCGTGITDLDDISWTSVNDSEYTFSGLTAATDYTAYVRTVCGEEVSNPRFVNFATTPTCPNVPSNVSVNGITATTAVVNWTAQADDEAWEIVVVPSGQPAATGTPISADTHPFLIEELQASTPYSVYVRTDCGGGDHSYWSSVKNFTTLPHCNPPLNVKVTQITGTSALVSWDTAIFGATSYTVEYSAADDEEWIDEEVDGTHFMISGLEPNTAYQVMVYSNCEIGTADTVQKSFTTNCLAGGDITVGEGTSTTSYFPSYNLYNYSYTQQIFTPTDLGGATELNAISFHNSSLGSSTSEASTQRNIKIYLMHTNATTVGSNGINASNATLVYSSPTATTIAEGEWNTYNFTEPFEYNGTQNLLVVVIDVTGSWASSNSWTCHTATAGSSYYVYQDASPYTIGSTPTGGSTSSTRNNVIFSSTCDDEITCIRPNVYVTEVSESSITLDWAPGNDESSWELEYSLDDSNYVSVGSISTHPYELSGLFSDTKYFIHISSNCGSEQSEPAAVSARTACSSINIPYDEDFEDAPGSGSGKMITCWTRNTNNSTAYPYTYDSQQHSGDYSVYFYGASSYYSYLASPRFDDNVAMDNLQVRFWARKGSANYFIQVGVMTDPNDYSTFVQIGEDLTPDTTNVWQLMQVNSDDYTGTGHYIAFRIPAGNTNYMYIDDIAIDVIPTCEHVNDLQMVSGTITANSAEIEWTEGGSEGSWAVVYGVSGTISNPEEETPVIVNTPNALLSGLTSNTSYDVYVKAVCSATESSIWISNSFRTACDAVADLPFIDNFDTYGAGEGVFPYCWYKLNTYSADRPYVRGTWTYQGAGSLYFYTNTANTYNMAATPAFDASISINTLQATFMYYNYYTTDRLLVGVMTDPTDATTFEVVDTVYATTAQAWVEKEVNFSEYDGDGHYIAFKNAYTTQEAYAYIDNLRIGIIPTCPKPTQVTAASSPTDSITVSWVDPEGTMWDVMYGPTGFNPDSITDAVTIITDITENPYTVSELQGGIVYDFYVRRNCGSGDVSLWSTAPSSATPYLLQMGTTGSATVTGCGLTIVDDGGLNGAYSSSCSYTLTIYPSEPNSLVSISGTLATESNYDYLNIYNGTSASASNLIESLSGSMGEFGPFVSEEGPLTLKFTSDGSVTYDGFVATVSCVPAPTCIKPSDFSVSENTSSSITVSWKEMGEATSWNVAYGPAGFNINNATQIENVTDTFFIANELTAGQAYDFYVQSDCSDTVSAWKGPITATPGVFIFGKTGNESITACDLILCDDGGLNGNYSHNCHYTLTVYPSDPDSVVSVTGTFTGEGTVDYLSVYDGNSTSGILLQKITSGTSGTVINFTHTSESGPLTFLFHSDGSVAYAGFTATVSCAAAPDCRTPYGLTATNISDQEATIHWIADEGANVELYYKTHNSNTWNVVTSSELTSDSSYVLTNLDAATNYDVYVATLCDDGDTLTSATITFLTLCTIENAPYSENFAGFNTAISPCWSRYTGLANSVFNGGALTPSTSGWTFSTNNNVFPIGHPKVNIYGESCNYWLVSPSINLSQLNNPVLMFSLALTDYYNTDPIEDPTAQADDQFMVIISTDNGTTWSAANATVWNNTTSGDYSYNSISTTGEDITISLSQYAGQTIRIAFYGESTASGGDNDLHIADVVVDEQPTCLKPTAVTVEESTTSTITLSWTSDEDALSWEIVYGAPGFDIETATPIPANTNPFTIQDLDVSTTYEFHVRTVCGVDETSNWSAGCIGSTQCDIITQLPYTESFDNISADVATAFPLCWERPIQYSSYPYAVTGTTHVHSSPASLKFVSSTTSPTTAVTPQFAEDIHNLSLNFWLQAESATYSGTFEVGVMTNPLDVTTFVGVRTIDPNTTWTEFTINFDTTAVSGTNKYIAFRHHTASASWYYWLDDVTVSLNDSTGSDTTQYTVTLNTANATMGTVNPNTPTTVNAGSSFTATATANDGYHFVAWTSNNATVSTANPYTFTVNADITLTATFEADSTPVEPCDVPANLHATNTDIHAVEIAWDPNANVSSWNIRYRVQDGSWNTATANTNSYTITGLTQNTTYEIQVQANCGNNNLSEWSSTLTVTTLIDGIVNYLESSVTLFPNPAKEYVDIRVDGELNVTNMEVFDVYGKLLNTVNVINNPTRINVNNLSNGMYFVRVTTDKGTVTKTFVKK